MATSESEEDDWRAPPGDVIGGTHTPIDDDEEDDWRAPPAPGSPPVLSGPASPEDEWRAAPQEVPVQHPLASLPPCTAAESMPARPPNACVSKATQLDLAQGGRLSEDSLAQGFPKVCALLVGAQRPFRTTLSTAKQLAHTHSARSADPH